MISDYYEYWLHPTPLPQSHFDCDTLKCGKRHVWKKSQKKIRREQRQKGAKHGNR